MQIHKYTNTRKYTIGYSYTLGPEPSLPNKTMQYSSKLSNTVQINNLHCIDLSKQCNTVQNTLSY